MSQDENHAVAGLVVYQHPKTGLYQQLVESSWARLVELEMDSSPRSIDTPLGG